MYAIGELDRRQGRVRSRAAAGLGVCGLPHAPRSPARRIPPQLCLKDGFDPRSCTSWSTRPRIRWCSASVWPQRATSCRSSARPRRMPPARQTRSPARSRMRSPSATRSPGNFIKTFVHSGSTGPLAAHRVGRRVSAHRRAPDADELPLRAAGRRRHALRAWQRAGRLVGYGTRTRSAGDAPQQPARSLRGQPDLPEGHRGIRIDGVLGAADVARIDWHGRERRHPAARQRPALLLSGHDARRRARRLSGRRRVRQGGGCTLPANPNPEADTTRALTAALIDWVVKGTPPPPSRYPRLDRGELVAATKAALGFPDLPGLSFRDSPVNPVLDYDFGPRFVANDLSGVISLQPPRIRRVIPTFVPKVNADGNETAGVPSVLHQAPLGTYLGWNLTAAGFFAGQGCGFAGGYVPFAKTEAERASHPRSAPLGRGALRHARGLRLRRRARRQAGSRRAVSVEGRRRSVGPRGPSKRCAAGGGGEH